MKIRYQNKPSEKLINYYCKKIGEFLSAHKLSLQIELFDSPPWIEYHDDVGNLTEKDFFWIKKCKINSQTIGDVEIRLPRFGIDEGIDDYDIWRDAFLIQDKIYKYLKLIPPKHFNEDDPYWKLWSYKNNF